MMSAARTHAGLEPCFETCCQALIAGQRNHMIHPMFARNLGSAVAAAIIDHQPLDLIDADQISSAARLM